MKVVKEEVSLVDSESQKLVEELIDDDGNEPDDQEIDDYLDNLENDDSSDNENE